MKIAGLVVVVGILCVSVAVGLYDYRAGLAVFGTCAIAAGLWNLTQE